MYCNGFKFTELMYRDIRNLNQSSIPAVELPIISLTEPLSYIGGLLHIINLIGGKDINM